ncbi:LysR family transcriptional regulator [Liquorilactobacillus sp.]|uniref:LysR family transcriptional regulator n=1 Tax=Liquorilactobacillus sp. TaxID=2767923 RepID=UPI0039E7751A
MFSKNPSLMLQYLDVLLKHSNFTKAAKDLYISQPYLTQIIKQIEQELGVPIIDRQSQRLKLSEAGKIYYHYLEKQNTANAMLTQELSQYTHPDKTIIKLGVLQSLGSFLLPLFLPKYLQEHPSVHLILVEDVPTVSEKLAINGEIDFFIGQNPETIAPPLRLETAKAENYYAIIPSNSPFFEEKKQQLAIGSIPIKTLLSSPLVLSSPGSAIRNQVDSLFNKYKIKPQIIIESQNIITAVELATHGLGLTLVPTSIINKLTPGAYNLYPLSSDLINLNYFIAMNRTKTLGPYENELVESFLTIGK